MTVPVAALGDTVAVRVTLVPTVVEVDEAANAVVVAVVLEEDELLPLLEPHPATRAVTMIAERIVSGIRANLDMRDLATE